MNSERHPARVLVRPDEPIPSAPTGRDLTAARLRAALSPAELEAWTGRHRTTIKRMERGTTRVDPAVWFLLLVLGGLHPWPAWAGWRTVGGALYSPRDLYRGYKPEHIERAGYWRALARALEEERDHEHAPTPPLPVDDAHRRGDAGAVVPDSRRLPGRDPRPGAGVAPGDRNARGGPVARRPARAVAPSVA